MEGSHGYGQACSSGAMIGYIQNMDFDEILSEVNSTCCDKQIPGIVLSDAGWQEDGISRLDHGFERLFPISPFDLRHLWVDLRRHYPAVEDMS